MVELEVWVNGMTCSHCARAVTTELTALADVTDARVDAASGRVLITAVGPMDRAAVEHAVEDAGYTVRSWPALQDD
ncbi:MULTISPECIES: heavy-metal-associated domain-containing protein [unclassified Microbacterium]|uniref:heavy-metal-associated domain-containing protein n=1 Tax=unclassified Microbacterium TaxID=2609290 RepID=UPI00097E9594|nr:heavy metal-associated domain-containing protein [Microbacterium sp. JB110]RCS62040.1 heavy-metal-associated domain-containing protein [Microbacterium sp. JB110]SJM44124.1 Copper chaperone [Frigoribacterium sp. JB110]